MNNSEWLAWLDLPEDTQKIMLVGMDIIWNSEGKKGETVLDESLAGLAFRRRDEIITNLWRKKDEIHLCLGQQFTTSKIQRQVLSDYKQGQDEYRCCPV